MSLTILTKLKLDGSLVDVSHPWVVKRLRRNTDVASGALSIRSFTFWSSRCGRGGTGRRATLRSLWANARGSSSLLDRTIRLNTKK